MISTRQPRMYRPFNYPRDISYVSAVYPWREYKIDFNIHAVNVQLGEN